MVAFFSSFHVFSDWGLLALRLAIAMIFLYHGPKKFNNLASFMGFIGICETLGALAVGLGFLTQLAALGLAIIMAGAGYKKIFEWHMPFSSMEKTGWELDLILLAACLALFAIGGGAMAMDAMWLGL